ncbi:hypothetical protein DFP72DRAFT_862322 [Ephemerocybe angulata]|uniref:Uncharacterized protein n=1 Tax=Ephemerocybe angulata TaxID=980116 RepID=A0A8H6LSU8_9AGAR|nr:hypothetical protein DFP72DRAFT_862322 [Tulosesus angulatus]
MSNLDFTLPPGMELCRKCADYAECLMRERSGIGEPVQSSPDISLEMRGELEKIVDRVREAWDNQARLHYSMEQVAHELQRSTSGTKHEHLRKKFTGPFPPKEDGSGTAQLIDEPMLFVDQQGKAVCWYLPGIFTARRCDAVYEAVKALSDHPNSALRINKSSQNWRDDRATYSNDGSGELKPGHINMSIAWYEQGHTVWIFG